MVTLGHAYMLFDFNLVQAMAQRAGDDAYGHCVGERRLPMPQLQRCGRLKKFPFGDAKWQK